MNDNKVNLPGNMHILKEKSPTICTFCILAALGHLQSTFIRSRIVIGDLIVQMDWSEAQGQAFLCLDRNSRCQNWSRHQISPHLTQNSFHSQIILMNGWGACPGIFEQTTLSLPPTRIGVNHLALSFWKFAPPTPLLTGEIWAPLTADLQT